MAFTLALAQMLVAGGDRQGNLARAEQAIAEAARHGSRAVVLPEVLDLGWTDPSCKAGAEPIPDGEPCRRLSRAAAAHGVHVCAGLTERCGSSVYNAAVLLSPEGSVLCTHRKINELQIGHPYYDLGDRLTVARTDIGTVGVMICADANARDRIVTRSLCLMGAELILSPCAWAVEGDHDNVSNPYGDTWRNAYKPVAKEFSVWIAGVSNVGPINQGPWAGRKCIGCSLVVDPQGNEAAVGPYGADAEALLYVDVVLTDRPEPLHAWRMHWQGGSAD